MAGEHRKKDIDRLGINAATVGGKTAAEIATTASDHGALTGLADTADHTWAAVVGQGALSARPSAGRLGTFFYASDTGDLYWDDGVAWNVIAAGVGGNDPDAIHGNVTGEIAALVVVAAASGDRILAEDLSDGNKKKQLTAQSIADLGVGGADGTAIHVGVAAEIAGIAVKAAPVGADPLVIEDSAAGFEKKQVTLDTIPGIPTKAITEATTLSAVDGTVVAKFASTATVTLPLISGAGIEGISYLIHHDGTSNVTVAVSGTDVFRENGISSGASKTLTAAGDNLAVTAVVDSPNRWNVI